MNLKISPSGDFRPYNIEDEYFSMGDDVLEGTYSGVYEHGNVSIQWRDNWPAELTDETKKSWISRYLVMKKEIVQVGDGEPQETTTIKPLSDYVGETFSEKTLLENVDAGAPEIGKTKKVVLSLLPVEFEVTKWEPVITQPQESYTTAWGNRNPPENQIDDEAFVAEPPNGKDTFVLKADVKLKPLPIPAADLARIASEWKVAILQDVVALPTADYKTYVGQTGGAGSFVTTMAPIPGMDAVFFPDEAPDPDNYFPFKKFTTGNETLSLEYEDTPKPEAFGGTRIYQNVNSANSAVALINLKRDVTFVTWVYAEHVPTKSRQFLKWIRWQTAWDIDVDGDNFAPPKLIKKSYTFRKIDEGTGQGPVTPSFTKAQKSSQFVPAQ